MQLQYGLVRRIWPALAVLFVGTAWGAAPSYSTAGIVHIGNYAGGPFAPSSILAVFGTNLARSSQSLVAADIKGGRLPLELNYTRVYVDNLAVPLFFVSETQVNFMLPARVEFKQVVVRVVREGQSGPEISIPIVDAAPALFVTAAGYAIATHGDNSLVAPETPARAGEEIVIWATGLGRTSKSPETGEIPPYASGIINPTALNVTLGALTLEPALIKYAGLTPGSAGLYQINLVVPPNSGVDPEIRVAIDGQSSPASLKLAVR
jgi:uncharacterized protein (TIGR03437 family)